MIGGPVLGSGPPLFFAASVLPPFRFAAAGRWLTQPVRAQGPRLFPSLQTRPYLKNMRPELFEKLAAQLHRARAREADLRNQLKWSTPAARERLSAEIKAAQVDIAWTLHQLDHAPPRWR